MEKVITINECIHVCPFFGTSMDGMECMHPYFDNKGAYENMIISQGDIIPKKCPLRKEECNIIYTLNVEYFKG